MSEGPEVKRTADKIAEAVLGKSIVDLQGKTIEHRLREKIVGSKSYPWILMAKISLSISQVAYFCAII